MRPEKRSQIVAEQLDGSWHLLARRVYVPALPEKIVGHFFRGDDIVFASRQAETEDWSILVSPSQSGQRLLTWICNVDSLFELEPGVLWWYLIEVADQRFTGRSGGQGGAFRRPWA